MHVDGKVQDVIFANGNFLWSLLGHYVCQGWQSDGSIRRFDDHRVPIQYNGTKSLLPLISYSSSKCGRNVDCVSSLFSCFGSRYLSTQKTKNFFFATLYFFKFGV